MGNCNKCGFNHQGKGIEIRGRTLHRTADPTRHMLTQLSGGPAWAFEAALIKQHPEIDYIIITDRTSGQTWRADR